MPPPCPWGGRSPPHTLPAPLATPALPCLIPLCFPLSSPLCCPDPPPPCRKTASTTLPSSWGRGPAARRSLAWRWRATSLTPTPQPCGRPKSQVGGTMEQPNWLLRVCRCQQHAACVNRPKRQARAPAVMVWPQLLCRLSSLPSLAPPVVEMMPWRRLDVGGQPHDHGFVWQGSEVWWDCACCCIGACCGPCRACGRRRFRVAADLCLLATRMCGSLLPQHCVVEPAGLHGRCLPPCCRSAPPS